MALGKKIRERCSIHKKVRMIARFNAAVLVLFLCAFVLLRHTYMLAPNRFVHPPTQEEIELFIAQELSTAQAAFTYIWIFLIEIAGLAAVVVNVDGVYGQFFSKKRIFHIDHKEKAKLLLLVVSFQLMGFLFTRYCVDRYVLWMELLPSAMFAASFFLYIYVWGREENLAAREEK